MKGVYESKMAQRGEGYSKNLVEADEKLLNLD